MKRAGGSLLGDVGLEHKALVHFSAEGIFLMKESKGFLHFPSRCEEPEDESLSSSLLGEL